ncbi:MAG: prepilin-type N-terminal cleavage/methylation domain-containing protein [Opitutus sp.]
MKSAAKKQRAQAVFGSAGYGRSHRGFTMVELLVAAAITVMLAAFIAEIVRNVGAIWARAGGRLGADAQARIVLDQLQLDLQGALYRDDGNVWLAADVLNGATGNSTGLWRTATGIGKPEGGLSLQMAPENMPDARFGTAGVWLRFFTTSRGVNVPGAPESLPAPVAVGYQIIRRFTATNPAGVATAYLLHRAEVRPAAVDDGIVRPGVLESGYDITGTAYQGEPTASNNGAVTGDPLGVLAPGSDATAPRNLDAVIADNVIDFGIRCYVRDAKAPGGLRLVFPARDAGGQPGNDPGATLRGRLPTLTPPDASNYNSVFPEVVDIMIRILTRDGAALIAGIESAQSPVPAAPSKYNRSGQQWWWGIAQENSRVHTRRIVMPAASR